jgi:pilus assembly protein Flp/PilA
MSNTPFSRRTPKYSRKGQGMAEYALILILVAVVVALILVVFGPTLGNTYSSIVSGLRGVIPAGGGNDPDRDCQITFNTDYHGTQSATLSRSTLEGADSGNFYWNAYGSLRYRINDANPEDLIIIMNSGVWHSRVMSAQHNCDPYGNK